MHKRDMVMAQMDSNNITSGHMLVNTRSSQGMYQLPSEHFKAKGFLQKARPQATHNRVLALGSDTSGLRARSVKARPRNVGSGRMLVSMRPGQGTYRLPSEHFSPKGYRAKGQRAKGKGHRGKGFLQKA